MSKLINNLIDLGFSGFTLWICFILFLHWIINQGFRGYEKFMGVEHKVYVYDFVLLFLLIVTFIYGIYKYK